MNKYIVAVSGGIDSVVLLDILSRQKDLDLIVAHLDHGIRDDSHLDREFVSKLADKYDLPFESKREDLGPNTNEETARIYRYKFLRGLAKKHGAKIITAHHADDVVETIAINLSRGTGWRGLAVLDSDITRPLTDKTKLDIIEYAKKNNLKWHDDSTNVDDKYLRNRIRKNLTKINDDAKRQLLGLWVTQKALKNIIDQEVKQLIGNGPSYSRYFFTHINESTAIECLRFVTNAKMTRPQLFKLLHAIKTIQSGKKYITGDVKIVFTSRNFTVELLK